MIKTFIVTVITAVCLFAADAWGAGSLFSGTLSTPILFDSSVYVGEPPPDYANRTPVDNPPGGLSATAAWAQYGMKLDWNVTDTGNGTYTYYYHFWPGWEPATNGPTAGGGGGTGNPYVTNKEVLAFDIQLGSAMTMANISNPTWNVYQYNGAKIGSGTANTWVNYDAATGAIISQSSDYDPADYPSYNYTNIKVANLKGKTGNATGGYLTQYLFNGESNGLQWSMPTDPDTGGNLWKADINFDMTFTSTFAPGWGNFFTNSGQTGANNNYSEVVAFDGTFDATGKSIATWLNAVSTPGTQNNAPGTMTISAPSPSITGKGPIYFTVTYNYIDTSKLTITLSTGDITLNKTGSATGAVAAVTGTGNARTVTINNISGDGTLGISIAAGTATDGFGYMFPKSSSSTFFVDNTPPAISSVYPNNGDNGLDINTTPTVIFNESVLSLDNTNFTVSNANKAITGTVNYYDVSTNQTPLYTAVFTPYDPLSYNTTYTATVTTGVTDLAGNPMVAAYTWTFTTVPLYGDLTGTGGALKLQDAIIELQIAAGLIKPTALQLANGDVAPLVNGKPHPDGKIDISDVVAILMKLVGLVSW